MYFYPVYTVLSFSDISDIKSVHKHKLLVLHILFMEKIGAKPTLVFILFTHHLF